jgi:hypothetical protein
MCGCYLFSSHFRIIRQFYYIQLFIQRLWIKWRLKSAWWNLRAITILDGVTGIGCYSIHKQRSSAAKIGSSPHLLWTLKHAIWGKSTDLTALCLMLFLWTHLIMVFLFLSQALLAFITEHVHLFTAKEWVNTQILVVNTLLWNEIDIIFPQVRQPFECSRPWEGDSSRFTCTSVWNIILVECSLFLCPEFILDNWGARGN